LALADNVPDDTTDGTGETVSRRGVSPKRAALLQRAKDKRRDQTGTEGDLLERIADEGNLARALLSVVRNKGAAGIDGQTVDDAEEQSEALLADLHQALLSERYRPQPVRRVTVPKPDGGGDRNLGVPTVRDRVVQQAMLQILEPLFDPGFHEASCGFRKGRGVQQAVSQTCTHLEAGYRVMVDLDLSKFFDRVHHQRLLARIETKVADRRVLRLIRMMLKAKVAMSDGVHVANEQGTPQGGPLSPLLSNIVLDELDWELARRGLRHVRYADDFLVFVRSQRAGARVMASLRRFVERRLRLKINDGKSGVIQPDQASFLGFRFECDDQRGIAVWPSKKSYQRISRKIRELIPRNWGNSLEAVFARANPYLRGWMAHFRLCTEEANERAFHALDAHCRRRLRAIIVRQKKRRRYLRRHLLKRGVSWRAATGAAYRCRGAWRASNHPGMTRGYPNAWFKPRLASLKERWKELNPKPLGPSEQIQLALL
jgi:group II intron reverse transcriptase/maturase